MPFKFNYNMRSSIKRQWQQGFIDVYYYFTTDPAPAVSREGYIQRHCSTLRIKLGSHPTGEIPFKIVSTSILMHVFHLSVLTKLASSNAFIACRKAFQNIFISLSIPSRCFPILNRSCPNLCSTSITVNWRNTSVLSWPTKIKAKPTSPTCSRLAGFWIPHQRTS